MTDRASLWSAVVAAPADDVVRLVFADWLDDHDEPDRAELIRSQVRQAGISPWDAGFTELDVQCEQLMRAHPEWLDVSPDFVSYSDWFCGGRERPFERGFLKRLSLTPGEFVRHRKLFSEHPITEVLFALDGSTGQSWLRQPALSRLRAVEFNAINDDFSRPLFLDARPRLRSLESFGLINNQQDDASFEAVLASPAVSGVRSLWFSGGVDAARAGPILGRQPWPRLRRMTWRGISSLNWLDAPWVRSLQTLRLSDSEPALDLAQRSRIADVLPEADVRDLSLGWWALDHAGGEALGRALPLSRVESLALPISNCTASVLKAILHQDALANLQALYLSGATLDAALIERLAGTRLRVCALGNLSADALHGLARQPGLLDLEDLRLGLMWNDSPDTLVDALRVVLDAGTLPRLQRLWLYDTTPRHGGRTNSLGDSLAVTVANWPGAVGLRALRIGESLTRPGATALTGSPHLDGLQTLDARIWPADQEVERLLTERFGSRVNLRRVSIEF